MSDTIITVDGLGKKYRIRHQQGERYTALRDVIALKAKNMFKAKTNGTRPKPVEDFWALKNVSFEVKRGEVLGIIGRNGAGKSTLLKILSRITEPTEGRIELRGRVASLLEVGTGFHPELTGRENIYLNGAILGMTRAEIRRRFDEIVAFAEVEQFLDTPVKRYSSGMYVRLSFAVAAHLEPEILIIDEVLAVGDASFQKKCLSKMEQVACHGRTVFFVSHNMAAVQALTQRTIWLEGGKLRKDGDTQSVVNHYLSSGVAYEGVWWPDLQAYQRDVHPTPVRFKRFWVDGYDHIPTVAAGSSFTICMEVETDIELRGAEACFEIKKTDGTRVTVMLTDDSDFKLFAPPGRHILRCFINSLHLTPGGYIIDFGISESVSSHSWDVILNYPLFVMTLGESVYQWPDRPWAAVHCSDLTWSLRPPEALTAIAGPGRL